MISEYIVLIMLLTAILKLAEVAFSLRKTLIENKNACAVREAEKTEKSLEE